MSITLAPVVVDHSAVLDDKLALVTVTIKCYSGYRRATREYIQELGGSLPDSAAVTEGSIKVFPNERLNPFSTLRRSVFRKIAAKGVKALGSGNTFAVPRDALHTIEAALVEAREEFEKELGVLDANYEAYFEEHVKANQEAEVILRKLGIPKAVALTRFGFDSHIFKIVPIKKEGEGAKSVSSLVEGLARQLFEEVAAEADKLLEKSDAFTRHQKAGQKTIRPIKDALTKMKGLEFLDPVIGGGIQLIEDVLSSLPQTGYIEDSPFAKPFSTLRRLLEVMSDVDDYLDASGRVRNGIPANEVLFPPAPVTVQAVQQQEPELVEEQSPIDIAMPDLVGDVQAVETDFDLGLPEEMPDVMLPTPAAAPMATELLMF